MLPEPLEMATQAYELRLEGDTIDKALVLESVELFSEIVHSVKEGLSESRTAHLWFQYLDLLGIFGKDPESWIKWQH